MAGHAETFTIGVEEEYQIIDPATRELRQRGPYVLPKAQSAVEAEVQAELHLSQIEIATPVCHTLADVRAELVRLRRNTIAAAAKDGNQITAAGTHPFSHWDIQQITPKDRYQGLVLNYQQLARENVIFGCHVHIGLRDQEAAIHVLNRARIWLAPLLALSANSPFWLGQDTGYASFRTQLWSRWPIAGPPQLFESRAEYDALVQALISTGSIQDPTTIYWDLRLPERIETVEFRVTDVCLTVDEAVMIAGLARALVRTCYEQALRDVPFPTVRHELLRPAHWRAARYGLEAELIDVVAQQAVPAREMMTRFLDFVRPALEAAGEWDEISSLVWATMERGTGAARQRDVYKRTGRLENVVDFIVAETAKGTA
jgi:carboxylate-amine ligase